MSISKNIYVTPYGEVEVTLPIKFYKKTRKGQPDLRTREGTLFKIWARDITAQAKTDYELGCV